MRALAHAPVFIVIKDQQRRVLWSSRYGYGWTAAEVVGQTLDEWVEPSERTTYLATERRVLETGDVVSGWVRIRVPDDGPAVTMGYRLARWPRGLLCWYWDASGFRAEVSAARTPKERAILQAATTELLSARALANRAGLRYNSRFRETLADLVSEGLLVHVNRAYRLPIGPIPR